MKIIRYIFGGIATAFVVSSSASAKVKDSCPFLPQYQVLVAKKRTLPPEVALERLYAYRADDRNENPAACEAMSLDDAISERETSLVHLVTGPKIMRPRAVFHCDALDARNLEYNGTYMDGTGQPNSKAVLPPPTARTFTARIENRLTGSRLQALYRTTLDDVQVGRRPVKLSTAGPVTIAPSPYRTVVIAIVSGPGPNRIRKFVWYP